MTDADLVGAAAPVEEPMEDVDNDDEMTYDADAVGKERKLTPDGGVIKTVIKAGTGWEMPEKGDKVTVHYVGTLEDGTEFDSSRGRGEPFVFSVGQGSVIKGWDLAVPAMKRGEVAKVVIKSEYGYGAAGSPPKIPGGATLVFEIELLSWHSVKDIAGDGGVIKTTLEEGSGWGSPAPADEVRVRLAARLAGADAPFYETPAEGAEFTLSEGLLCKAVGVAAAKMKKGERAALKIAPAYGFGDAGRPDLGVPAGAALEAELTLVSWNKVENVTDDGAVVKKTLADTDAWERPNSGATVRVALTGRLADGTVFASATADAPLEFVCDDEAVPDGLDAAVQKMKKGERALVTVAPSHGYGDAGAPAGGALRAAVPGGATLAYEVELLSFDKAKETWEMDTPAEKLEAAAAAKGKGAAAFKAGKWARAAKAWERAKQCVEYDDAFDAESRAAARALKRACDLNLAAAHLKAGAFREAAAAATKVLDADPGNAKALYRRAQALLGTGDFVEAELDIKRGLASEPASSDFRALHRRWRAAEAEATKAEAAMWSGGFAKAAALARAAEKVAGKAAAAEVPPTPAQPEAAA